MMVIVEYVNIVIPFSLLCFLKPFFVFDHCKTTLPHYNKDHILKTLLASLVFVQAAPKGAGYSAIVGTMLVSLTINSTSTII